MAFEALVGDLLEAEWGGRVRLERFGRGPDGGIDLRTGQAPNQTIVQCKHVRKSGWAELKREIGRELSRLPLLKPGRYIVATSLDLSPGRKDEIAGMLAPWLRSSGDVLGGPDIEALVQKHERVERAHPALWMPSATVIERLLHAGMFQHTAWTLEDAKADARIFVRPLSFEDAREKLRGEHVCIIAGPPGIGKTMLARMLLLEYVHEDFEPVVVRDTIDEAVAVYASARRQVFFFDDFLGQTDISQAHLPLNADDRLASFVAKVRQAPNKRFIFTTREYVLRDALRRFERLRRADAEGQLARIVLDLSRYARVDRALILYNHLWALGDEALQYACAFRPMDAWKPIVDHAGFNPRVVRVALADAVKSGTEPRSTPALLVTSLNDPTSIWRTILQNFDDVRRCVVRTLLMEPPSVPEATFFNDCAARVQAELGVALTHDQYLHALDGAEGTFVRVERPSDRAPEVGRASPSVQDFLASEATRNTSTLDVWLAAARRLDHLAELVRVVAWGISRQGGGAPSCAWLGQRWPEVVLAWRRIASSEASDARYRIGGTDIVSALCSMVRGTGRAPWTVAFVERLVDDAVLDSRWISSSHVPDLVRGASMSDQSAHAWVAAGVNALYDWADVDDYLVLWREHRDWFDGDTEWDFRQQVLRAAEQERDWAVGEAEDEDLALQALDEIDRILGVLGEGSPTTERHRERIRERFGNERSESTYVERTAAPKTHVDDDAAIARLFATLLPAED